MGPELSAATLNPFTTNWTWNYETTVPTDFVKQERDDYLLRLGKKIAFFRENFEHENLRVGFVTCPHIDGVNQVAYTTVWGNGMELRLCGKCDEAFRAHEATRLD